MSIMKIETEPGLNPRRVIAMLCLKLGEPAALTLCESLGVERAKVIRWIKQWNRQKWYVEAETERLGED